MERDIAQELVRVFADMNEQRSGTVLGYAAVSDDRTVDVDIVVTTDLEVAVEGDGLDVVRSGAGQCYGACVGKDRQSAIRSVHIRPQIQQCASSRIVCDPARSQRVLTEDQPSAPGGARMQFQTGDRGVTVEMDKIPFRGEQGGVSGVGHSGAPVVRIAPPVGACSLAGPGGHIRIRAESSPQRDTRHSQNYSPHDHYESSRMIQLVFLHPW